MTLEETARQIIKDTYGDDVKITNFKSQQGSEPGENYGSIITALTITVETANDNKTTLHWMAKCLPPSTFIRKAFNVKVTFPKEIDFYQTVLTEYSKLLKENNIDIDYEKLFPKFIGARIAEDGDITIIMKNIKMDGYRLGQKSHGVDFDHSTLVMKNLALFHALGVALKRKNPQVYETKIKKTARIIKQEKDFLYGFSHSVLDYLKEFKEIEDLLPRLEKVMDENLVTDLSAMNEEYGPREPFSTLVHNDFWLNNIMFQYDNNTPISVKFLDFQRTKIGSPMSDLMMFLYVSTSLDVMKFKFDELLKLYHDNLVESLRRLGVSDEDFRWEKFEEELKIAREDVGLTVGQLRFFFKKEDSDISELKMASWAEINSGEECKNRYIEVVKDLARRGWI